MADQAPTEDQTNEPEHIKELRQQARNAGDLQKQLDEQKRELAFARAGVDTESKLGKMLFQTFDGELTADAIQGEAKEIGLLKPPSEAPSETPPAERKATDQRQDLASGSLDDGTPPNQTGEDPQLVGIKAARARLKDGEAPEVAFQSYVQSVVDGAVAGDERVVLGKG